MNGPMVARLRKCADDTSPNWDGRIIIYPPEARELVDLIDASAVVAEPEPITDHVFRTGGNTYMAGITSGMCVYFGCNRPPDDHAASRTQWGAQ